MSADFPITALGVTSEAFRASLHQYMRTNPDMPLAAPAALSRKVHKHSFLGFVPRRYTLS